MMRPPPRLTLSPSTMIFRSVDVPPKTVAHDGPVYERPVQRPASQDALVANTTEGLPRPTTGVELREIARKSTRLNSSHVEISYAVFCLKKKKTKKTDNAHVS